MTPARVFALLALLVHTSAAASALPITFQRAPAYPTGEASAALAILDLNGDAFADVIVANSGENTLSVLYGTGRGGLTTATHHEVGDNPVGLAVGDFDGDGRRDVATASGTTGTVSVLFGTPAGPPPTVTITTDDPATTLQAADFDGDGRSDLLIGHAPVTGLTLLRGRPLRQFVASRILNDVAARRLAAGDLNGDGRVDLVVDLSSSGCLEWRTGDGHGAFSEPQRYGSPCFGMDGILAADVNNDGRSDVLATNGSGPFFVHSHSGQEPGYLEYSGLRGTSLVVSDFNGDGSPDVVLASSAWAGVAMLLGVGDGTFTRGPYYNAQPTPSAVAAGDLDSDGVPDLVVAHRAANEVTVLLGRGDGSFSPPAPLFFDRRINDIGDFDGDGHLDLLGGNVLLSDGAGRWSPISASGSCFGHFDQDGLLDRVTAALYPADDTLIIRRNGTSVHIHLGHEAAAAGDIDGDGIDDILIVSSNHSPTTHPVPYVAVALSASGFQSQIIWEGPTRDFMSVEFEAPSRPVIADFDGDGRDDAAWVVTKSDFSRSVVVRSVAFGNLGTCANVGAFTGADIDADGVADVVGVRSGDGQFGIDSDGLIICRGSAAGISMPALFAIDGGLSGRVHPAVADFDGDGLMDIAASQRLDELHYAITILRGTGSGFERTGPYAIAAGGGTILAADFNRDGRPDLVFPRDYVFGSGVMLSIAASTVIAGDVDGDGIVTSADLNLVQETFQTAHGAVTSSNSSSDCNTDGQITAADVLCVFAILHPQASGLVQTSLKDVDRNGSSQPLADGLLILRRLFGFGGATLTSGAVGEGAVRSSSAEIQTYVDSLRRSFDIDRNGTTDALTDGLLLLRFLLGFRGATLVNGAVAPGATRADATAIAAYLGDL